MIYEVMSHIRNFFVTDINEGKFTIENGKIKELEFEDGSYILIRNSRKNNGVYCLPYTLKDEEFEGEVDLLCPPDSFLSLCGEIETYNEKTKNLSPFASESFGGYSYTRATNSNGTFQSWQDAYRSRLNTWRKI